MLRHIVISNFGIITVFVHNIFYTLFNLSVSVNWFSAEICVELIIPSVSIASSRNTNTFSSSLLLSMPNIRIHTFSSYNQYLSTSIIIQEICIKKFLGKIMNKNRKKDTGNEIFILLTFSCKLRKINFFFFALNYIHFYTSKLQ